MSGKKAKMLRRTAKLMTKDAEKTKYAQNKNTGSLHVSKCTKAVEKQYKKMYSEGGEMKSRLNQFDKRLNS